MFCLLHLYYFILKIQEFRYKSIHNNLDSDKNQLSVHLGSGMKRTHSRRKLSKYDNIYIYISISYRINNKYTRHHWGCAWLPGLEEFPRIVVLVLMTFLNIFAALICFSRAPKMSLYTTPSRSTPMVVLLHSNRCC